MGLRAEGPKVVAIGGGHGLAVSLRAARRYAGRLTGIVTVADDGGSSGRLRRELGIVPPGDLRMCLVALANEDVEPSRSLALAFEHRFEADEVAGHALGNLLIAALVASTGDLQKALDTAGTLLGAVGRVFPAASEPVVLKAEASAGEIRGQTAVHGTAGIQRVSLIPSDVAAPPEVVRAIAEADQIVIGPGSLFTSVLAALAVPEITKSLATTSAQRVYVANLRPQSAETSGFDVADHMTALKEHGVSIDTVVADISYMALGDVGELGVRVVVGDLAKTNGLAHDPGRLADVLADLVA